MPKTVPEVIRNRHAEWNAFWDPFAVETMLSMATDIRIFPLDITNQARLKKSFLAELKTQSRKYQLSRFVSQAYKLVEQEKDYEMWNTLATAYLSRETNLFEEPENMMLEIVPWGFEQGWIRPVKSNNGKINNQIVYFNIRDHIGFYQYVLAQFKKW
jgi:purine nucleosidase